VLNRLRFTKMQGVGNDFVVIDGRDRGDFDWSGFAIEVCDRNTGIGADGLLVLGETAFADIMMRMYNPDGTPDVCGNGLRCVARYAVERRIVTGETMRIGTLAGTRVAQVHRGPDGAIDSITVTMGQPRLDPASIPMRVAQQPVIDYALSIREGGTAITITALSTGSTHAVTFVTELPDDELFFAISPEVEHHPLFPDRTSLMWCHMEGDNRILMRIWERGAGETWGCGTGACAAGVAAVLHGFAAENALVTVVTKGGALNIRWKPGAEIHMTGPAEFVYEGSYPLDPSSIAGSPTM
jgi:diaminopimelate epimerase